MIDDCAGNGDGGYRRSAWGVPMSVHDDHNYYSAATDTPGGYGYGTDEAYGNGGGRRGSGGVKSTGRKDSYRSRESSGWGLTSDDGGDGDHHHNYHNYHHRGR